MTIRQVREVPARRGPAAREPYVAKDVRDFMRLVYDAAAVESDGRDGKTVAAMLRRYIKVRGIKNVNAVLRNGTAYLVRED